MKLYNSLTHIIEPFTPVKPREVSMYVCGPTVYHYIHIGNARPVVFFDVVKRYFTHLGYTVNYASNITDVDDKIVNKAIEQNTNEKAIASEFEAAFMKDMKALGSETPNHMPRATDYIDQMIQYIEKLIATGFAYNVEGDVYFRVSKAKDYGRLSKQVIDDLDVGARIERNLKKENPLDFTLWKKTGVGVSFKSPWGEGRPGWHTECVVMNECVFGDVIDIHGGGSDLKFPHHENEIAQANALRHHSIANVWMHVGRLDFGHDKMSKSLGNTILVRDLLKTVKHAAYRLLLVDQHYRQPISYTQELMTQYTQMWDKIERSYQNAFLKLDLEDAFSDDVDQSVLAIFHQAMQDDFNTPNAMTALHALLKTMNIALRSHHLSVLSQNLNTLFVMLDIFGLKPTLNRLSDEDKQLYQSWMKAREDKDFARADTLRLTLTMKGIIA